MNSFDQFLTDRRFRSSMQTSEDQRNPFENDFSRVVFSSSFRRLQDKTQVFQLDKGDFVRTRLTHSIEVSSLGRSIGLSVENRLIDAGILSPEKRGHIPSILATAGLVHDIGNPPFGHFGEWAIQDYFRRFFRTNFTCADALTPAQQHDFIYFDGNVQTFRVLRKLHYIKDSEGMNLTFAVLATIVKYPCSSLEGNTSEGGILRKKFGYFQSEAADYADIAREFSLSGRYPLTFLLEAADDIAYSIADIEDACKKGLIGYMEIRTFLEEGLQPISLSEQERDADFITLFTDLYNDVAQSYKNKLELAVQRFRIVVQRFMISAAVDTFYAHIDEICAGTYNKDLLENSWASNIRRVFKDLGQHIFAHKTIIEKEVVGFNIIHYLLDEFVEAVSSDELQKNPKQPRLYNMISSNYRFIYEHFSDHSLYSRLQLAVDYISGMTDNFALKRYRIFRGIE
ncbi:dGTP triphosphohydrolase [Chitinivibrio alkaliphilus]|uniref:Deoxyguanosinetriphosphate triphosphohydrolase n=1 Tax=Chitinivibrio alkaliphilus ACht1 TaxID=1313304 RepID=U7D8Y8_9BACT|nr:dNTP triphosphohydrolase [Chitinivibrio alkaliphilus]ERP31567.1 deoxyguanosinetriphosphate triphosphohydrolase [Chitinivibrio alkaliphilus ACht1]